MTESFEPSDLKARPWLLKPKTLAAPAEVPPIVLLPEIVLDADHVAQIRAAGIGAEEISDHHFVWAVDLKASDRVEAEDVCCAGRGAANRVVRRLEKHADGVAQVGAARVRSEEIPDDNVGGAVGSKASRGIEAKDIGCAGRGPTNRVVARLEKHADRVAQVVARCIGAEQSFR